MSVGGDGLECIGLMDRSPSNVHIALNCLGR